MNRDIELEQNEYEEPLLLGAEDLENVAGGCIAGCSDGSCSKQPSLSGSSPAT